MVYAFCLSTKIWLEMPALRLLWLVIVVSHSTWETAGVNNTTSPSCICNSTNTQDPVNQKLCNCSGNSTSCPTGYSRMNNSCVPCTCNTTRSPCDCINETKPTLKISCGTGQFLLNTTKCTTCSCNPKTSYGTDCDNITGQCACKPYVMGRQCNACMANYTSVNSNGTLVNCSQCSLGYTKILKTSSPFYECIKEHQSVVTPVSSETSVSTSTKMVSSSLTRTPSSIRIRTNTPVINSTKVPGTSKLTMSTSSTIPNNQQSTTPILLTSTTASSSRHTTSPISIPIDKPTSMPTALPTTPSTTPSTTSPSTSTSTPTTTQPIILSSTLSTTPPTTPTPSPTPSATPSPSPSPSPSHSLSPTPSPTPSPATSPATTHTPSPITTTTQPTTTPIIITTTEPPPTKPTGKPVTKKPTTHAPHSEKTEPTSETTEQPTSRQSTNKAKVPYNEENSNDIVTIVLVSVGVFLVLGIAVAIGCWYLRATRKPSAPLWTVELSSTPRNEELDFALLDPVTDQPRNDFEEDEIDTAPYGNGRYCAYI